MRDTQAPGGEPPLADPGTWAWLPGASAGTEPEPEPGEFRHACRIGPRWLLIPAGAPAEVSAPLECARLPFTQGWCLGLASFRGDLVPVYDLGALWGEPAPASGGYFLVLGRRDARGALRIDEIAGFRVPPDTPSADPDPLPELPGTLVTGGLAFGDNLYAETDLLALLRVLAGRASLLAPATPLSTETP